MVEIIHKGQLPEEKKYVCTCRKCKTKFSFKAKESKESCDQRDGVVLMIISCPLCSSDQYVNKNPENEYHG